MEVVSTVVVLLSLVSFNTLSCNSEYIHVCNESSECMNTTINCLSDIDCRVICNGYNSCKYTSINCPNNHECNIECSSESACEQTNLNGTYSSKLTLIDCTGTLTCSGITLKCPPNDHGTKKCFISGNDAFSGQNHQQMFYAIYGWNDIDFTGYNGTFIYQSGTMHCTNDYSASCPFSKTSWQCNNSNHLCNNPPTSLPTISQTFLYFTHDPTTQASTKSIVPTNAVHNKKSSQKGIFGSIMNGGEASVAFVIIILICIVICLLIGLSIYCCYSNRQIYKLSKAVIRKKERTNEERMSRNLFDFTIPPQIPTLPTLNGGQQSVRSTSSVTRSPKDTPRSPMALIDHKTGSMTYTTHSSFDQNRDWTFPDTNDRGFANRSNSALALRARDSASQSAYSFAMHSRYNPHSNNNDNAPTITEYSQTQQKRPQSASGHRNAFNGFMPNAVNTVNTANTAQMAELYTRSQSVNSNINNCATMNGGIHVQLATHNASFGHFNNNNIATLALPPVIRQPADVYLDIVHSQQNSHNFEDGGTGGACEGDDKEMSWVSDDDSDSGMSSSDDDDDDGTDSTETDEYKKQTGKDKMVRFQMDIMENVVPLTLINNDNNGISNDDDEHVETITMVMNHYDLESVNCNENNDDKLEFQPQIEQIGKLKPINPMPIAMGKGISINSVWTDDGNSPLPPIPDDTSHN